MVWARAGLYWDVLSFSRKSEYSEGWFLEKDGKGFCLACANGGATIEKSKAQAIKIAAPRLKTTVPLFPNITLV